MSKVESRELEGLLGEEGREDSRKAGGTEARLTLEFAAGAKVVMFVL